MAGIDKTYTDSYENYKMFKVWADSQSVKFFNGHVENIGDYVWQLEENDFQHGEIPIMNSQTWLDVYLLQHCKSQFVLDRLNEVYGESTIKDFKQHKLWTQPSNEYRPYRQIKIKCCESSNFPLHNHVYDGKMRWWVQSQNGYLYHEKSKTWVSPDSLYPSNTNTAHIKSIKGVVRHLRKQYLPKGISFRIIGRYVGEEYVAQIK